mmetsp:Transcript_18217/g.52060  ORF Transcript_18217/g.52060 Transcript_18217/m.52060 type:complete len:91 (-) Transcript_18217:115-387(-)
MGAAVVTGIAAVDFPWRRWSLMTGVVGKLSLAHYLGRGAAGDFVGAGSAQRRQHLQEVGAALVLTLLGNACKVAASAATAPPVPSVVLRE